MRYHLISAAFLISPTVAHPDVLCVYPLSGAYAPLQRILFYVLIAFGVLGRRQRWLVAGALASAMSYGGAAAMHSVLLLAKIQSQSVDLDIYGVFAVTSTGAMLTGPLLAWSTTLHTVEKEVRTIILLWAVVTATGALLAVASIFIKNSLPGPECLPSIANTSSVASLHNATDNCFYACFQEQHPLFRSPGDIVAWKNKLDAPGEITSVFLPTIAASIPSTIMTWIWILRWGQGRPNDYLASPAALKRLELGWIVNHVLGRKQRRSRVAFWRMSSSEEQRQLHGRHKIWIAFQYYAVIAAFGGFVVNLALNEVRFRALPTNEMVYEVGQWGPWVGVALVVFAQVLSQLLKAFWRKKERGDEEEMRNLGEREGGDGSRKEMVTRSSTFQSEFRRRNSF